MLNKEAEMVKYFRNTFLSVKVSFCNEMYQYCKLKGIDYKTVRQVAASDKRIGLSHTQVPGHDNKLGFGGGFFKMDASFYDSSRTRSLAARSGHLNILNWLVENNFIIDSKENIS